MKVSNNNLFRVTLKMPEELHFLDTLSENAWWTWQHDVVELMSGVDTHLWSKSENNLKLFINSLSQEKIELLSKNKKFLSRLDTIEQRFEEEVGQYRVNSPEDVAKREIAYFSLEYGIHESLRLYSGGLGVLAGDHLKAASDLSVPMVAVGLLYKQGYFAQKLDKNGWQHENYPENELQNMPLMPATDTQGREIKVSLPLIDRNLLVKAWVLNVGSVPLVLLDTNTFENPDDLREITARLYGGDKQMRLYQELVLAVAGYKVIRAMGYPVKACHLNEGHAAFLSFARIGDLVSRGIEQESAMEIVWRSNIFTTHTPVPAGNETFQLDLLKPFLEALQEEFKLDIDTMISLGRAVNDTEGDFSMTILGLRMSAYANGVSRLHGEVAQQMWTFLWQNLPKEDLPITSITNGVHVNSWLSSDNKLIFDEYLSDHAYILDKHGLLAEEVDKIPYMELWSSREKSRLELIHHARSRMKKHMAQRNESMRSINLVKQILNPHALTIGFARRFATYKRATLLLRDKERLARILKDKERPIQVIFAGKAHPADEGGKTLIQELNAFIKEHNLYNQLVFLEDYDIELGRYLTQGVDVWLNNPIRPQEASGTSGMKAAINGVLNCSISDGWWEEGYEIDNHAGWVIRHDKWSMSAEEVDNYEANALYTLIEEEILPTFYQRNEEDIPLQWVAMMKSSIAMSLHNFASARMVSEYRDRFYNEAKKNYDFLSADNHAEAKKMVEQKRAFQTCDEFIQVDTPTIKGYHEHMHVGESFQIETSVYLSELKPEDVEVEVYYGEVDNQNMVVNGEKVKMKCIKALENNRYQYETKVKFEGPGRLGLTACVRPVGDVWIHRVPPFIKWAD